MKLFFYLLVISALSVATMALPQFQPDKRLPQITITGGGAPKQGNIDLGVRQQFWQSPNQRHTFYGTGGYGRNWGEPKPEYNLKDYRIGAGYTFRFGS